MVVKHTETALVAVILRYLSSTIIIVIMLNHLQGAMRTGGVGPAEAEGERQGGREGLYHSSPFPE